MAVTETVHLATDGDAAYVKTRQDSAHWYAWGRLDEMSAADPDRVATIERGAALEPYARHGSAAATFAEMCAREARMYRTGERSSLASIMDQWARFLAEVGA